MKIRSYLAVLPCLIAVTFCLSTMRAGAQVNLEVLRRDGYGMVSIKRPQPNSLTVQSVINGRVVTIVLDTGWGSSGVTIDSDYIRSLKISTEPVKERAVTGISGRQVIIRKGTADSVTLGNVQIRGVPLFFGIFQGIRDFEMRRAINVDGFVGSGFLRTCSAVVDLHNLRLYLRPPGTGRRADLGPALRAVGLAEVPFLQSGDSNCYVDVEVDGVPTKMVIDTGASLSGLDRRFAARMKSSGHYSGIEDVDAAGIHSETQMTTPASFKIGGFNVRPPDILLGKYELYSSSGGRAAGLMGMDMLGQNWSIIDFGQQKLYFAPAK